MWWFMMWIDNFVLRTFDVGRKMGSAEKSNNIWLKMKSIRRGELCSTESCPFFLRLSNADADVNTASLIKDPISTVSKCVWWKVCGHFAHSTHRNMAKVICVCVCEANILAHLGRSCVYFQFALAGNFCRIFFAFAISYPISFLCVCVCVCFCSPQLTVNAFRAPAVAEKQGNGDWVHSTFNGVLFAHRWQV